MLEMGELVFQDVALKVRDLQARFDAFEADSRMSDYVMTEIDEELEEGRVSLEKLDKRVRELETDLPELIAERVATLKTENAELRDYLNLVIDAVNNITRIWNEAIGDDGEQSMEDNEVLPQTVDNEVLTLQQDEPRQLTLEEVYNMYQSQPQTEQEPAKDFFQIFIYYCFQINKVCISIEKISIIWKYIEFKSLATSIKIINVHQKKQWSKNRSLRNPTCNFRFIRSKIVNGNKLAPVT